jgi:hypothetical protein
LRVGRINTFAQNFDIAKVIIANAQWITRLTRNRSCAKIKGGIICQQAKKFRCTAARILGVF